MGYPGDLRSPEDSAYGEHMYEMYLPTEFDLATSKKLLQYEIDTFGGNSGSPVIVKDDMRVIGVHVLGGNINSASVIGPLGNVFETYKRAFDEKPDPSFDVASKVPSRDKTFRVVSIPPKNQKHSEDHKVATHRGDAQSQRESNNTDENTSEEALTEAADESASLRSLLESSVHTHTDPDQFLGKLQHLLEPEMVSAMSEACNGAEGLVTALRFLWNHNEQASESNEALLSTLAKHKSTAKHIGHEVYDHRATIERIGKQAPIFRVLTYGLDAANEVQSATDESVMDHIAHGLSVTVPVAQRELPKLGAIGLPIATIAASFLHMTGTQAAARLGFPAATADPTDAATTDPAPEGEVVDESVPQGLSERAVLAEVALHGIMHLPKGVLKHNKVFEKIQSIVKPLAPIMRRADPMVSSLIQPAITKVALGSVQSAASSTPSQAPQDASQTAQDTSQPTQDAPQITIDAPSTPTADTESAPFTKIGRTVTFDTPDASTADGDTPDPTADNVASSSDAHISALTQALTTAHPHLAHVLPALVERGMKVGHSAFSTAAKFGLPILLGGDKESEYNEQDAESAVPVSGLAQRALLAEAALQVLPQLPAEVVRTLEVPDLDSTLEAFEANAEGHDEADASHSTNAQIVQATGAMIGGVSNLASSVAGSATGFVAHKDMLKNQDLEAQKIQLEHNREYTDRVFHNMDATKSGLAVPYPNLQHHGPDKNLVIPDTDREHPGSPRHPNQASSLPQQIPTRSPRRSPRQSPQTTGGGPPPPPPPPPKDKPKPSLKPSAATAPASGQAGPSDNARGKKPAKPPQVPPKKAAPRPKPPTSPKSSAVSHIPLPIRPATAVPKASPTHSATSSISTQHSGGIPLKTLPSHGATPTQKHIPAPSHPSPTPPHPRNASPTPSHPSSTLPHPSATSPAKKTAPPKPVSPKPVGSAPKKAGGKRAEGEIAEDWLAGFGDAETDEAEGYEGEEDHVEVNGTEENEAEENGEEEDEE